MEEHHIHENKIAFHGFASGDDLQHATDFLKRMHHQDFNHYLDKAKHDGGAHFIDPSGKKFAITHDAATGGFSVQQVHHSHLF